jgi:flavodoxin
LTRRSLLRAALAMGAAAVAGTATSGCDASPTQPSSPPTGRDTPMPDTTERASERRILLAYYSRAGENYYYGGRRILEVGNTEVLARMIRQLIACDVYRIEAADPYSDDYDATVDRNVREQNDNARPGIANPRTSISDYDTVLVGSPIWNDRAPMIMSTFVEGSDFSGKTLHPFVTYAVSGLGSTRTRLRRLGTRRHDRRRSRGTRRIGAISPVPGGGMAAPDSPAQLSPPEVPTCRVLAVPVSSPG